VIRELLCGLRGHKWDKSRIDTDLCLGCYKIRFVTDEERLIRTKRFYLPIFEAFANHLRETREALGDNSEVKP
jgi:hypothetical protein